MKYTPHPYQKRAQELILQEPAVALWMEMGLGKTVATLTAVSELLHDRMEVNRVLVIAPLRVASVTWTSEAEKWDHLRYLTFSKVLGTKAERLRALEAPADIYLINRENVPWLVDYYKMRWPFDCVVIDESSSFKNPQSKRFRALRRVRPKIKRIIELTGTPAPNGLLDLWAQVYLLDQGARLGATLGAYRRRWFVPGGRNGNIVYEWIPREGAGEEIEECLKNLCFSMAADDWIELPGLLENDVEVTLSKEAREIYNRLERDQIAQLPEGDLLAQNAAVLTGKLLQLGNGAIYDEQGGVIEIHDAKLDALEEIAEAVSPLLVYYSYRHDLDRIKARFPHAQELQGAKEIEAWNRGDIPMLLAHPASAGHGLNLQQGGHHICWFGLPWSLELYQQANARLYRQGQERPVIIHHIIAKDTYDQAVLKALSAKDARQDALLDALKAYVRDKQGG